METFLLEQAPHVPFLLPFFERRELESLSSCSRRLACSLLRDVFFQHSLVVVPVAPDRQQYHVCEILAALSPFTRHVAFSNPSHLLLLRRLPLLCMLRLAKPKTDIQEDHEDDTDPISLRHEDVIALWHLSTVTHLELDAGVEDVVVLFRDMVRLESLDLVFRYHIGSIDLLAHLQNLRSLCVRGERLDDVSAVRELTNLVSLELSSWGVHDISALSELERLKRLDLHRCSVVDLTPIAELTHLRCLKLEETPLEDLRPLTGLVSLEFLSLARSRVSDLTPLGARALSLHYLDLSGCTLAQVRALQALSRLDCLRLHKTTWSTIGTEPHVSETLASLPNLRVVDGRLNPLMSLHPEGVHTRLELSCLQRMSSLETLELTSDSLSGSTIPIALPHLVFLSIEWNYTRELDVPLAAVMNPRLRKLHLTRLRLKSLNNLRYAPQLQELRLIDVYLEDLSMLCVATNLTRLEHTCALIHNHYLEGDEEPHDKAPTDDLEALASLTRLQHLDLSFTSIRSLQPLQHLAHLCTIDLSSTDITDLAPLASLPSLECIRVRDTEILQFDGGAFCRVLRELALPEHVDCRTIRERAPVLKKLLHPDRDCLWTNHFDETKTKRLKRGNDKADCSTEARLQCAQT